MEDLRRSLTLYAVTDHRWLQGRTLESQIELSLQGGCTMVQLREKDMTFSEYCAEAESVLKLCRRYDVPLIINDNAEAAAEIGADGVHVGQSDMSPAEVRRIVGADKIIGVSARTADQALAAQRAGASYLGVGAVFVTLTKHNAAAVSIDTLRSICSAVSIPVVAIGGINKDNIMQLCGSGICGVAVVSGIFASPDILNATHHLRRLAEAVCV